ncbi:MAG: NADPH-dependent FMN reductase [Inhella sp.]
MHILAISGSLRADSINSALCRVACALAPAPLRVTVYAGLGSLPLFNPDLEPQPPAAVGALRAAVAQADALFIASPEYAHGISGPMKNALDWLVSFEGSVAKPVALVNTSPRAHHAYAALAEVLRTMAMVQVPEASVTLPLLGTCTTEAAMRRSDAVCHAVRASLEALARHAAGGGAAGPCFALS